MKSIAAMSITTKIRRRNTLEKLSADDTSIEVRLLALVDKLSNIKAISRDYDAIGDELWKRFNQHEKSMHGWYYGGVAKAVRKSPEIAESSIYKEYESYCKKVFGDSCVEDKIEEGS